MGDVNLDDIVVDNQSASGAKLRWNESVRTAAVCHVFCVHDLRCFVRRLLEIVEPTYWNNSKGRLAVICKSPYSTRPIGELSNPGRDRLGSQDMSKA